MFLQNESVKCSWRRIKLVFTCICLQDFDMGFIIISTSHLTAKMQGRQAFISDRWKGWNIIHEVLFIHSTSLSSTPNFFLSSVFSGTSCCVFPVFPTTSGEAFCGRNLLKARISSNGKQYPLPIATNQRAHHQQIWNKNVAISNRDTEREKCQWEAAPPQIDFLIKIGLQAKG